MQQTIMDVLYQTYAVSVTLPASPSWFHEHTIRLDESLGGWGLIALKEAPFCVMPWGGGVGRYLHPHLIRCEVPDDFAPPPICGGCVIET